jgi:drug/metabolite transporter (DMT)-like permease
MNPQTEPARRRLPWLPLALLLVLGCLWSLAPSAAKFAAINGVSAVGLVFWQTVIAGTILLGICLMRGQKIAFDRRSLRYYLVMGWLGILLPNMNMVVVLRDIDAGLMSVMIITSPVITYVLALAARMERFIALRAAGIVLGFAGAAVLVLPRGSLPSPELLPIALLAFVTPALWAVANIFAELARPADGKPYALAMGTMYAAAAGALVGCLMSDSFYPLARDFALVDAVIIGYGVVTALTFTLFYVVVALAGAVYLAQVGFITTLTGLGWAALFFGERPGVWLWLAMALIFAGVAMVNLGKPRERAA